jgi:hypothetical protein
MRSKAERQSEEAEKAVRDIWRATRPNRRREPDRTIR